MTKDKMIISGLCPHCRTGALKPVEFMGGNIYFECCNNHTVDATLNVACPECGGYCHTKSFSDGKLVVGCREHGHFTHEPKEGDILFDWCGISVYALLSDDAKTSINKVIDEDPFEHCPEIFSSILAQACARRGPDALSIMKINYGLSDQLVEEIKVIVGGEFE